MAIIQVEGEHVSNLACLCTLPSKFQTECSPPVIEALQVECVQGLSIGGVVCLQDDSTNSFLDALEVNNVLQCQVAVPDLAGLF